MKNIGVKKGKKRTDPKLPLGKKRTDPELPMEVSFVEIKNIKTSKLDNKELLDVQKQVESFLKFLNSEYETVKKLEEENS